MEVQWVKGNKRPERAVGFVLVQSPVTLRLLCRPEEWVRVWLHWVRGRSVPCYGRHCSNCQEPPRPYAYGACCTGLFTHGEFRPQRPAILCCTDSAWRLTEDDHRSSVVQVERQGSAVTGEMVFKILGGCKEPIEPPFDVRGRLMTIWKIRQVQDMAKIEVSAQNIADAKAKILESAKLPWTA